MKDLRALVAGLVVEVREFKRRLGIVEVAIGSAVVAVLVSSLGVVVTIVLRKAGLG